jgi:hypothetical protein
MGELSPAVLGLALTPLLISNLIRFSVWITGCDFAAFTFFLSEECMRSFTVFNNTKSAMTTEEDRAWFQSTFRPIPKPELPDDAVAYSIYHIPSSPTPAVIDEAAETRARLLEVQRTAADLTKDLLKDYIWQREAFKLEITKEDGTEFFFYPEIKFKLIFAAFRSHLTTGPHHLRRLY